MASMEFWFEYGSTYSYLSVARIGRMAQRAGVEVVWRPFLLMPILSALGMPKGPFLTNPAKMNYMWRDLERRAAWHGIPFRKPSHYPPDTLLTARIGMVGCQDGWCREFTERTFALHWTEDRPIGSDANLGTVLREMRLEPAEILARAHGDEIKASLRAQTERARTLGIFGSPSFIVDGELYWGDDRLKEAMERACTSEFVPPDVDLLFEI